MNLIGDVKDKVAVLVDDMIDTAGTITNAAKVYSLPVLYILNLCSRGPATCVSILRPEFHRHVVFQY